MALCQVFKLWSLNQYNLKEVMGAFDVNALHTTHQDTMCFLSFFVYSTEEPSIPFMVRPPTNGLCSQLFVVFLLVSFLLDSIWYLSSYHLLLCHVHSLLIPFSTGLSPSFLSVCVCMHCVGGHGCYVLFVRRYSLTLLPSVPWACFVMELKLMIL